MSVREGDAGHCDWRGCGGDQRRSDWPRSPSPTWSALPPWTLTSPPVLNGPPASRSLLSCGTARLRRSSRSLLPRPWPAREATPTRATVGTRRARHGWSARYAVSNESLIAGMCSPQRARVRTRAGVCSTRSTQHQPGAAGPCGGTLHNGQRKNRTGSDHTKWARSGSRPSPTARGRLWGGQEPGTTWAAPGLPGRKVSRWGWEERQAGTSTSPRCPSSCRRPCSLRTAGCTWYCSGCRRSCCHRS
jgi:hypothetical protein